MSINSASSQEHESIGVEIKKEDTMSSSRTDQSSVEMNPTDNCTGTDPSYDNYGPSSYWESQAQQTMNTSYSNADQDSSPIHNVSGALDDDGDDLGEESDTDCLFSDNSGTEDEDYMSSTEMDNETRKRKHGSKGCATAKKPRTSTKSQDKGKKKPKLWEKQLVGGRFNALATHSDLFASARRGEALGAQIHFDAPKDREEAFRALIDGAPPDKKRAAKKDVTSMRAALTAYVPKTITPAQDGSGKWCLEGMSSSLESHQALGTGYMRRIESNDQGPKGGILADSMGLGKTVMTLALIVNSRKALVRKKPRATLIVVPPSLLTQWQDEIEKHCHMLGQPDEPGFGIGIVRTYRGTKTGLTKLDLEHSDIVLTTHNEVMNSVPKPKVPKTVRGHFRKREYVEQYYKEHCGLLHRCEFFRVVVDEAHLIKNPSGRTSLSCRMLNAKHHWVLTATPMMNTPAELYALFDFIKHSLANDGSLFSGKKYKKEALVNELNQCMLRRTNDSELFGRAIITLPTAHAKPTPLKATRLEYRVYSIVEDRFIEHLNQMSNDGNLERKGACVLALTLRLRQLASHPLLIQPILSDLLEESDLEELNSLVDDPGYQRGSDATLARLIRKMLSKASKQRRRQKKEAAEKSENDKSPECVVCHKIATNPYITTCDHIHCHECLNEALEDAAEAGKNQAVCEGCGDRFAGSQPFNSATDKVQTPKKIIVTELEKKIKRNQKKSEGDVDDWLDKDGKIYPSAKVRMIKEYLPSLLEDSDDKIIVYTQWLDMTKVLAQVFNEEGWGFCHYNGTMNPKAKDDALTEFHTSPRKRILIASLKAGGLGLNLTCASEVINMDPW